MKYQRISTNINPTDVEKMRNISRHKEISVSSINRRALRMFLIHYYDAMMAED